MLTLMKSGKELLAKNLFPLLERCLSKSVVKKLGIKQYIPKLLKYVDSMERKSKLDKNNVSIYCDYCNKAHHTRKPTGNSMANQPMGKGHMKLNTQRIP